MKKSKKKTKQTIQEVGVYRVRNKKKKKLLMFVRVFSVILNSQTQDSPKLIIFKFWGFIDPAILPRL